MVALVDSLTSLILVRIRAVGWSPAHPLAGRGCGLH
jgi:hypothetical protein